MNTDTIEQQLAGIQQQLNFITEEMKEYSRRQREIREFKEDFTLIARDVFQAASEELDEVAQHFETADLLHLLKKLLRNTRNLNRLIDQLDSAQDLLRDAAPLGKIVFDELLHTLDKFDRRGYFEFLRELSKLADEIVTAFSPEDVRMLRENIVSILLTVKTMTRPEILGMVNNAISFFEKMEVEPDAKVSYIDIFKSLKDPQTRRGIAFMLHFVRNMASPNGGHTLTTTSTTNHTREN